MKNIAVVVYDLMIEYNVTVIDGIVDYFKDREDVTLILAPVNVPKNNPVYYDYQYWTSVEVLKVKPIDAVIVITNSFLNYLSIDELSEFLKPIHTKQIVSIGPKLNIPNSHYTFNDCEESYEQVVEHLINKHNRKKIGFFSASYTNSPDSISRVEAYKKALQKNNLEFHEEWILPGDFTPGTAEEVVYDTFGSKEDIPFDAILCANDYTAAGCLLAFYKLGVKVPEDICVFGFDNTEIAMTCHPTVSTIKQNLNKLGQQAADAAYKIACGEKCEEVLISSGEPLYRQSCGCVSLSNQGINCITQEGKEIKSDEDSVKKYMAATQSAQNLIKIYNLLGFIDTNTHLEDFIEKLPLNMTLADIQFMAVCFYENPETVNKENIFTLPQRASLYALFDNEHDIKIDHTKDGGKIFNPNDRILPEGVVEQKGGVFTQFPLFFRDLNYGYIICQIPTNNYCLLSIYLRIITTALIQAYELSKERSQKDKLVQRNLNLNLQSKTDELTGIFNRRGFYEYGQRLIDISTAMGKEGCVFFFDLDGLKKINDNYGHKIGDVAIQTEAKVLKEAFRDSDLVGRLSGDEFAAVAPGFSKDSVDVLRKRLVSLNEKLSEEAGLPFILSISVGATVFTPEEFVLQTLLQEADKTLYNEKQIKHGKKD